MIKSLAFSLVLVLLPSPLLAQDLPRCAVGMHVEKAGGTNEPGVITDANEVKGSYLVDFDDSTQEWWMGSADLARSCIGAPAGAKDLSFFLGPWDEHHIPGAPDLLIKPDHTYEWIVSADPAKMISGEWRRAEPAELDTRAVGPGVVLTRGLDEQDWLIESQGSVDLDNQEQILATAMRGYDYYYFSRVVQ